MFADLALNPNTLVNNYSASISTPTSPQGNDSNIVQYSQGPTPNQSPINCKANEIALFFFLLVGKIKLKLMVGISIGLSKPFIMIEIHSFCSHLLKAKIMQAFYNFKIKFIFKMYCVVRCLRVQSGITKKVYH